MDKCFGRIFERIFFCSFSSACCHFTPFFLLNHCRKLVGWNSSLPFSAFSHYYYFFNFQARCCPLVGMHRRICSGFCLQRPAPASSSPFQVAKWILKFYALIFKFSQSSARNRRGFTRRIEHEGNSWRKSRSRTWRARNPTSISTRIWLRSSWKLTILLKV